jgi:outer membrane protein OmpA-like peptidoglycan-associated protein
MRHTIGITSLAVLTALGLAPRASAQGYDPPPPPAPPPPAAPAPPPGGDPYAPGPQQPPPAQQAPPQQPPPAYGQQPPPQGGAGFGASASASTSGGFGTAVTGTGAGAAGDDDSEESPEDADERERERRAESLHVQNSLNGSTGLLRVHQAGSGAEGTFRFSLSSSYFTGTGFLCPSCATPGGGPSNLEDDATAIAGHIGISATPVSFLEAYFGLHNSAASNSLYEPQLLQVLGDMNLGLKGFMPWHDDQVFSAGGALDLFLLNGTGAVGLGAASFGIRGLATADFSNRTKKEDRIPLRTHFNLGYVFDNSGKLVEDIERDRSQRITRIERFGLGINRTDRLQVGLGLEGILGVVHPFLEWSIDVPVNRQGHVCDIATRAAGDGCLGESAGFSTTPSRLGLGARLFPWLEGLAFLGGVEIGTGATGSFIEEVVPEVPWNLHFGIAYAADTKPRVEVKRVEVDRAVAPPPAAPLPGAYIDGVVVDPAGAGVPGALVHFEGSDVNGFVTSSSGQFRTHDLDPGTYTFTVSASGYRTSQCTAVVPPPPGTSGADGLVDPYGAPAPGGGDPSGYPPPGAPDDGYGQPGAGQPGYGQPGYGEADPYATAAPSGPRVIPLRCELQGLPQVGNVDGSLRDAATGAAVTGATVKITDRLGRSLTLSSDATGSFRFENVPPGVVTIAAEAPGYFRSVIEVEIKARQDVPAALTLGARPAQPTAAVQGKEIRLRMPIAFTPGTAQLLPSSLGVLQEVADLLTTRGEIAQVEIQAHTDDASGAAFASRLSLERAEAIKKTLILHGVPAGRLTAKGLGSERPLAPNTSDANRARNNRVQLMIP